MNKHFTLPNGTEGMLVTTRHDNITIVSIVIDPSRKIEKHDRDERIFFGTSFCNPKDEWNEMIGIRVACKDALGISREYYPHMLPKLYFVNRKQIYSAIRSALHDNGIPIEKPEPKEDAQL